METLEPIWEARIPGDGPVSLSVSPDGRWLVTGDGWGVAYAALRIRAIDADTGVELGSIRSGRGARAAAWIGDSDSVIVAGDGRLHQFTGPDLDEQRRWDAGVPRAINSIAISGGVAACANWRGPVALFDLEEGRTTRRPKVPDGATPFVEDDGTFVVLCRFDGSVWRVGSSGRPEKLAELGPCASAAYDRHARRLIAPAGRPWTVTGDVVSGPTYTTRVRVLSLATGDVDDFTFSLPVANVLLGPQLGELWLGVVAPSVSGADAILRVDAASFAVEDTVAIPAGERVRCRTPGGVLTTSKVATERATALRLRAVPPG